MVSNNEYHSYSAWQPCAGGCGPGGCAPIHIHCYDLPTTVNDAHQHQLKGKTAPAAGGLDCHIHFYEGTTTCEDGHVHSFCGYTGPAVPLREGCHSHKMTGQTSLNNGHIHCYCGFTGENIPACR